LRDPDGWTTPALARAVSTYQDSSRPKFRHSIRCNESLQPALFFIRLRVPRAKCMASPPVRTTRGEYIVVLAEIVDRERRDFSAEQSRAWQGLSPLRKTGVVSSSLADRQPLALPTGFLRTGKFTTHKRGYWAVIDRAVAWLTVARTPGKVWGPRFEGKYRERCP
jgi:hypothetical protein